MNIIDRTKSVKFSVRRVRAAVTVGAAAFVAATVFGAFSPRAAETAPVAASGAELFKTNCARCHGDNGTGGKGPNLASEKRQAKWRDSDEKLIKKITSGGMFMPSFGKKLTPEEIKAIADHVRTLKE